ncbi:hypothetical protein [Amycolatopsis sp. CA-126428]|uniref:hypothetical protein n=1 Tax=Amycolatopsis sp. CA-126428 TaxID=2073158 RepID=UPI00130502AF|nr:hypothetical protein [Amycolatopsis sp. CA-126428]
MPVPAAHSATPVRPAGSAVHQVTLVTGDQVIVSQAAGRQRITVRGRDGARPEYLTQRIGGDDYVIPAIAVPYLGKALDRALFDVSALIRAGLDHTPVKITARPGATAPEPGPRFGAALARQVGAEATGRRTRDGSLFGGVTAVRLDAPGAPQPVAPRFPMHTLKVHLDPPGAGDGTFMALANSDDGRKFASALTIEGHEARASVPEGHYSLDAYRTTYDEHGVLASVREFSSEFTVEADKEITVSAAKATAQLTVGTPRPTGPVALSPNTVHYDARGQFAFSMGVDVAEGPVFVQPTGPSAVGHLLFRPLAHGDSPADAPEPYSYDVLLAGEGSIAANQHYEITADQLTTVKPTFYHDVPGMTGLNGWTLAMPDDGTPLESVPVSLFSPVSYDAPRTAYLAGPPGTVYSEAGLADPEDPASLYIGEWHQSTPGRTTTMDFFRGPLAAGFQGVRNRPESTWLCQACRDGDELRVWASGTIDSAGQDVLGPARPGTVWASSYRLLAGDTTVAEGTGTGTVDPVTVPAAKSGYTYVVDQTREAPWIRHSTDTHTEWTFSSEHSGSRTVPGTWHCGPLFAETIDNAQCGAVSLLTTRYQLDTDSASTVRPGPGQLQLTFGHTPGTLDLPTTAATVEVSFDGGKTWTRAAVTDLNNHRYLARWTNPATTTATDAALRISGTDTAGNTISQTVTAAFTVAGPAQHRKDGIR